LWGLFIKNHKVLRYANVVGGGFIVLYVYAQLWQLGELHRIIAAAIGLTAAVVVSIIKLKEGPK
jgi:hypothetical protein